MAVNTRVIKTRIKSIQSTKKITKAMELVSASKMRRAVASVLASRPYATLAWETVSELATMVDTTLHALLAKRDPVRNVLIVFIASDRGLCGGFNAQMGKRVLEHAKNISTSETRIDFVTIGKRAQNLARKMNWNIVGTFTGLANNPSAQDIRPVAALAINDFVSKKYDQVILAFTDFESSLRQVPRMKQLLPITRELFLGAAHVGKGEAPLQSITEPKPEELHFKKQERAGAYQYNYIFEPSPREVLEAMMPRLVEAQIYQAILESAASEHAARMMAMRSASDAAQDFISDLVFTFNQARQASITREIAEISAGKITLE